MLKLGVLISGRGSNLQSLITATQQAEFPAKIACVISNKADAAGLQKAEAANIPSVVISHRDYATREDFDRDLDAKLNQCGVQLVCLAGFMRLFTPWFVGRWHDRLVNVHPSLLPAFPGLHPHRQALVAGVKFSGCTIHYVRPETDAGPIILQAVVPVLNKDDEESLAARVLQAEHQAYPAAVRLIAEGRVNIYNGITFVANTESPATIFNPALTES